MTCNDAYLLHDHDSVEEARASHNAVGHEVGAAHFALQVQVGQLVHLQPCARW